MKISIIGAGNVGSQAAFNIGLADFVKEILLLDITEGHAQGKAIDINNALCLYDKFPKITGGTNDYALTKNSDVIIITAGKRRTEDMTREDLKKINSKIVRDIMENSTKFSPNAIYILTSNPLDDMVYEANVSSKLPRKKILGMAGELDASRYKTLLSQKLNISPKDISALIMGPHNDKMLILKKFTTVNGIPIKNFINEKDHDILIKKSSNMGKEIISLMKTSSYFGPGAALLKMVKSIYNEDNTILCASTFLEGEYNIKNYAIGVPIKVGKEGIKEIIKIPLEENENKLLADISKKKPQ